MPLKDDKKFKRWLFTVMIANIDLQGGRSQTYWKLSVKDRIQKFILISMLLGLSRTKANHFTN